MNDPVKFYRDLDRMIIAGVSNSKVANRFQIAESSVRKRKKLLRESGLLPNNLRAEVPERSRVPGS